MTLIADDPTVRCMERTDIRRGWYTAEKTTRRSRKQSMSKYRKECWTDADVRCPFYISDERSARSITCEGCMDETKATMSFRTLANRDGHMGRFCVGAYERCPVYRSVYQSKYADGEA